MRATRSLRHVHEKSPNCVFVFAFRPETGQVLKFLGSRGWGVLPLSFFFFFFFVPQYPRGYDRGQVSDHSLRSALPHKW